MPLPAQARVGKYASAGIFRMISGPILSDPVRTVTLLLTTPIRGSIPYSIVPAFIFSSPFDGLAVARNIFLDGNTFRDSHSVEKEKFVACFVGGIGFIVNRFKITYSHVYQTREFKTQEKEQQYGAISLSFTF